MRDYDYVEADLFKEEALIRQKADIYRFLNESGYTLGRVNKSTDEYFVSSDKNSNKIIISILNPNRGRARGEFSMFNCDNINEYSVRVISNNYSIDSLNTSIEEMSEIISSIIEFPKRDENSVFISLQYKKHICVTGVYRTGVINLIYLDRVEHLGIYENLPAHDINHDMLLVKHIMDNGRIITIKEFVSKYYRFL